MLFRSGFGFCCPRRARDRARVMLYAITAYVAISGGAQRARTGKDGANRRRLARAHLARHQLLHRLSGGPSNTDRDRAGGERGREAGPRAAARRGFAVRRRLGPYGNRHRRRVAVAEREQVRDGQSRSARRLRGQQRSRARARRLRRRVFDRGCERGQRRQPGRQACLQLASATRGTWNPWWWMLDTYTLFVPGELRYRGEGFAAGVEGALALTIPGKQSNDVRDAGTLAQIGAFIAAMQDETGSVGVRVRSVIPLFNRGQAPLVIGSVTAGGSPLPCQTSIEVYGEMHAADIVLLGAGFLLNLDEPFGVFGNGQDVWGAHHGRRGARLKLRAKKSGEPVARPAPRLSCARGDCVTSGSARRGRSGCL